MTSPAFNYLEKFEKQGKNRLSFPSSDQNGDIAALTGNQQ